MPTIGKVFKTEKEARDKLATIQGQDDVCVYQVPREDGVSKVYILGFYKQAGEWQVFCQAEATGKLNEERKWRKNEPR